MSSILLQPTQLNASLNLNNHIVMAPMTRCEASDTGVATDEMATYYALRADSGLIITEGTMIRADGRGYHNVPGIYSEQQIAGWQQVTSAVHAAGGKIFCQLWHVGRVSHPAFLMGELPLAPSATKLEGSVPRQRELNYGESRAATVTEIKSLVNSYAQAANNAIAAGFDGVEIHGANGYLIDQFLHYHTNLRDDEYGGNAENMARFATEVVEACSAAIGKERVGIRLSPGAHMNMVGDKRDEAVFICLLEQLSQQHIAYVHTGAFDDSETYPELSDLNMTQFLRKHYHGTLIASGSYTIPMAEAALQDKQFDLIALGRPFIANPDLIHKLENKITLNAYDSSMLDELD